MKIRNKILIWFLFPSILIAAVTTTFFCFYTQKTVKQNIFGQLRLAVDVLHEHVHSFLNSKTGRIIDFSSDGYIKHYTEEIAMRDSREEYYVSALNSHLITNKKSIDPNICEIFIVSLMGKIIASTDEGIVGNDVSGESYFTETILSSSFVGEPYYDPQLKETVIDFSTVLLSKIGQEAIGVIVNRVKFEQHEDRRRESTSFPHGNERDYSELISVNKARITDFSSDGFIRDCTEEITKREDKILYYTDILNTYLATKKLPLDPDIMTVFIVDLTGKIIGSTELGIMGKNVSNEYYFSKTMKRIYSISDLHNFPGGKQNVFEVAKLLFDKDELNPIGIIVNRYNGDCIKRLTISEISEDFLELMKKERLGETGELYIVNGNKLMITESRFIKDAILKQVVDTEGVRVAFDNGVGMVGMYPDYRGTPVLGISIYFEEMDWVILSEKDVSEAFAPIAHIRNIAIIVGVASITLLVIIAIIISKGITRPILKLVTSTRTIAEGNLTKQIRVKSKDEVGYLAGSFDTMRIKIGELLKTVEDAKLDWESTFDSVSDIIILLDKDHRLTRCNKALLNKLDVKYEEVTGKRFHEIFYNKDVSLPECPIREAASTLSPVTMDMEMPNLDGIFSVSSYPRINNDGKYFGMIQIMRDITEQKYAEELTRELNTFNQSLLNALPFGMDIIDEEGNILYLSKNLETVLGTGMIGKKCWSVYRDNKKQCENCPLKIANSKDTDSIEVEGVLGGKIFQITHVSLMYKGKKAVLEIFNDITKLKQIEEALRKSHTEVEQLLSSIPSILIGVASDDRIIRWNTSAETTFEINSNDVVGLSFRKCGIRWDWDKVVKLISECRGKNKLTHLHNIRYKQKNGKDGFLDINITPITSDIDDRFGFLILGTDITKHKIMESQLIQAQKLESIGLLAAGIAHEINTPTQYINNNIQFLNDTFREINTLLEKYSSLYEACKKGTTTPKLLNEINAAIKEADLEYITEEIPKAIRQSIEGLDRVAKIVSGMKDFSHPGTEEKEAIDINKAIESTITVSRNEWKYVADVKTDFDSNLPLVPCFPGDFNQVILNIITNAAHAIADVVEDKKTDKGLISIRTRLDGEWVEISMSDSGAGIPEKIRANIFDPFFTTKDIGKGTGQGLAIAHSAVVEKHGGTITFNTEMGKGTTFIIRLPISSS